MSGDGRTLALAARGIALSPIPFVRAVALLGSRPEHATTRVDRQALALGPERALGTMFLVALAAPSVRGVLGVTAQRLSTR